mgnify:CR=1 FL=1
MSDCKICQMIAERKDFVYETPDLAAFISPSPAAPGHIIIAPKVHAPIIEMVPDPVVGELFAAANIVSMSVFEGLKAHGTNILIQNGVPAGQKFPHVFLSVIPRREKDGLALAWQPKTMSPEELASLENKLKEESRSIGPFQEEKPKGIEEPKKPEPVKSNDESPPLEEDIFTRQLRRIP